MSLAIPRPRDADGANRSDRFLSRSILKAPGPLVGTPGDPGRAAPFRLEWSNKHVLDRDDASGG